MQFTQFIFPVVSNFRLQAHDMKILKILVQPFVGPVTGFGHYCPEMRINQSRTGDYQAKNIWYTSCIHHYGFS